MVATSALPIILGAVDHRSLPRLLVELSRVLTPDGRTVPSRCVGVGGTRAAAELTVVFRVVATAPG
jgi:hypothetical protein